MKVCYKFSIFLVVSFVIGGAAFWAHAITWNQENLIGLANRFAVVVSDFEPDGSLSPSSVKSRVESQLSQAGIKLVDENSPPPLALINLNIIRNQKDSKSVYHYVLDLNVYNLTVINTTYKLRKGTIWMMGSYKVFPGDDFPNDVERKISWLITSFVRDYALGNPT